MQTATITKQQILDLLAQAEALLETATIDGMDRHADEDVYNCFTDIQGKLDAVAEAVDYYVD